LFAAQIRKQWVGRYGSHWQWHLDEMFVKINGDTYYLGRAVDHEGEVLEAYATKSRDRHAALRFLRKAMKRYGQPQTIITDRLGSYAAALKRIGLRHLHRTGPCLNNRAENSHQPMRRRERAMHRFRRLRSLRSFATIHSSVYNHFNFERHLHRRDVFKRRRCSALAEWRCLGAG
jgi:putative transposase